MFSSSPIDVPLKGEVPIYGSSTAVGNELQYIVQDGYSKLHATDWCAVGQDERYWCSLFRSALGPLAPTTALWPRQMASSPSILSSQGLGSSEQVSEETSLIPRLYSYTEYSAYK